MRLPGMTTRRWMIAVAVVAPTMAIISVTVPSHAPPTRTNQPIFDSTGEVFSIEPPAWSRLADPYDHDVPKPPD
jgi:hypothetical protein